MRNLNYTLLSASAASSQTSAQIDCNQIIAISFQAYFSDVAAAGTLKLQASNDPIFPSGADSSALTPTNWTDIPAATASVTSGASVLISITQNTYRWVRAVYTRSAGAGTVTITVNGIAL